MVPELGHYALILAICLASVQAVVPMIGAARGRLVWMRVARPAAIGQLALIGFAFFCLAYAFITNDFSVIYVAQNSNSQLPLLYRFCAVWGAHEGSLLLWVFILSIWMALVAIYSKALPLAMIARVLAILSMVSFGFLLFLLKTSDPFLRFLPQFPANGQDLNPLLQDPGLAIHPPMLYMGYVGFSVVFAFALAALISGRLDAPWARWSRPWTLIAWCFLTFGITLGSWWAYRELGWGGWWFWDPVENASFMPWLVGTALIHSLAVTEKRNAFKAWTVLLAICAFCLSLLGTFLVRSGVLISVHAFAIDPQRGVFMLDFLIIAVGASLLLYAWRAHSVSDTAQFNFCSRETMLLINNILLVIAMATILLGTLYPLAIDALGLGKISVGSPYFNVVFVPIMMLLFLVMGLGPVLQWRDNKISLIAKKLSWIFLLAVFLALLIPWLVIHRLQLQVVIGLCLAFWIILTTLSSMFKRSGKFFTLKSLSRSQYGMVFAHVGIAICCIGIVLTSMYSVQREVRMNIGDTVSVGPYQFKFLGTRDLVGPNYTGVEAGILVSDAQKAITLLQPQQRTYPIEQIALAKTAIDIGVFRDLYVALGEPLAGNAWAFRIYYKPFIRWIWWGGLLMIFGGLLAVSDKRYRLKRYQSAKTSTNSPS